MNDLYLKIAKACAFIPDKYFISIIYRLRMGKKMRWENPQSFSEKLQWLKIHNRNPEYSRIVDKYEMKSFVAERLGEGYTVPTIGLWDNVEDIDFDTLPTKFVIKCTHDSGSNVLCKDKEKLDIASVKKHLDKCLKNNLYYLSREWPYKNVKPRIIAEEFLVDKTQGSLAEYKLFCFDGEVKMVLVCKGVAHTPNRTNDFCDVDLNRLPFTSLLPNSEGTLEKPQCYDELLCCAAKLAHGFPQIRVDAYVLNNKFYFGELTLYHNSGLRRFNPPEWDEKLGNWIQLPQKGE